MACTGLMGLWQFRSAPPSFGGEGRVRGILYNSESPRNSMISNVRSPLAEILVVHHTHTDWGYTSHPLIVEQRHYQYIDEAVALCQPNADRDPAMRYRWTCEAAWVVLGYLKNRSPRQRQAFLKCIERGDIEVAGLPLHPTPLADAATIRGTLGMLDELRAEGILTSVAVGCDING